eukprot:586846-Amorphochlora_amoeboformis.AAC.1
MVVDEMVRGRRRTFPLLVAALALYNQVIYAVPCTTAQQRWRLEIDTYSSSNTETAVIYEIDLYDESG